jgi:valine--pyruvate aminotransferase
LALARVLFVQFAYDEMTDAHLSDFGRKFSAVSGIYELMEDLGQAVSAGGDICMMGGGNPAHIPEVEAVWRRRLREILDTPGAMETMLGDYDTPRGRPEFLETMAAFFNRALGWEVGADNIAITTGSQAANFLLFNLLAGPASASAGPRPISPPMSRRDAGSTLRRILFPIVPEYIGYAPQGIAPGIFTAWKPRIEMLPGHQFKYRIEFGEIGADVAAICLSRPTNPTANVITDDELQRLSDLAVARGIYLIVDNAYGEPFPGAIFRPARTVWGAHVIHTFSLSKLGLPGTRTGIVVADREIIRRLSIMNASLVLATGSVGEFIAQPLFASGEVAGLVERVVRPFYEARSRQAQAWIAESFDDALDYHVHVCEGAFFLWLWLRGLPIGDRELYERLKKRGVLVVPGSYFFPGFDEPWPHKHECIRVTYCAQPEKVRRGIAVLADEVKKAYAGA